MKNTRVVSAVLSLVLLTGMMGMQAAAYSTDYTIDGNDRIAIPETYLYSYSINVLEGAGPETRIY